MLVLTVNDVRMVEEEANESSIPYLQLMENAGSYCARVIRKTFENTNRRKVLIVCGKGKNGGDGFVIARKLLENGYNVTVMMTAGLPKDDISSEMLGRIRASGIPIVYFDEKNDRNDHFNSAQIIVDCIFGIGFKGIPDHVSEKVFDRINSSSAAVVSVDVPSGLCGDSGETAGAHVKADITVAITCLKPVHVLKPACTQCGQVVLAPIGIPEECYSKASSPLVTFKSEDIKKFLPKRAFDSHKGTYGTVLVIGGSYEMPGAAFMASSAAVNSGAGIVKLAFPDSAYSAIASKTVEQVLVPLQSNENGRISHKALSRIAKELENCSAVVIGCGMGVDGDTQAIVRYVIENSPVPVILDADGINAVKDNIDILDRAKSTVILTPHPGEMARLARCSVSEIQLNRGAAVKSFTEAHKSVLVLKGASTLVSETGNDGIYINTTGNPGLATGGSGDVLAGLIGSFCAQGLSPYKSAIAGVYIHGEAGDTVSEEYSMRGNTPSKLLCQIPLTLKKYE